MTTHLHSSDQHRARVLDPGDAVDRESLRQLRGDPGIEVVDNLEGQRRSLLALVPPPSPELVAEPTRWVYYPWRRTVVTVLGPRAFRRVRLDRNRNLIDVEGQDRLAALRVGIVGLSVGHAAAYTLAAQGLCGTLRLADFDDLDLTNLNRVPATVFDLGVNKATVAARRIAELDPYLSVEVVTGGVTVTSVDAFLDGVNIVVEECDSLDIKALIRQAARARRLPVVMATADRGLMDVERFDLQPDRPIFHGLLGDTEVAGLSGLSGMEKVPLVLRLIDGAGLSARGAASLVEIGHSLSTWPQLAADVAVGAGTVAEAVRRIGLGEPLSSGRTQVDVAAALEHLDEPAPHLPEFSRPTAVVPEVDPSPAGHAAECVAAAAIRAPSGGNAQPWRVETSDQSVIVQLSPEHTSALDVGLRASAVAVGAALFNARVAAAAHGVLGTVEISEGDGDSPLRAVLALGVDTHAGLSRLYEPMLRRETNRHRGRGRRLSSVAAARVSSAASREGGRLRLLTAVGDMDACARILGASDRIRYLTPRLHAEMMAELRWPGDETGDSGIDVASLELDTSRRALADILQRADVMAQLDAWDGGAALGGDTRARVTGSSAVAVVIVRGRTLIDYARGGSATEAVWVVAQQQGISVQPMSPVFLYAHDSREWVDLAPSHATELGALRHEFLDLIGVEAGESAILPLRLFDGPSPTVRSRRRVLPAPHRVGAVSTEAPCQ